MFPEIKKAVEFVIVFLPGFLCMGVVTYATGIELNDFRLTYLSVAIALGIYFVSAGIIGLLISKFPVLIWLKQEVSVFFITMGLGYGLAQLLIYAHQNDTLLNLSNSELISKRSPWALIFRNMQDERMIANDARPQLNFQHKDEKPFVRVYLQEGRGYEGFAFFHSVGETENELYLSPACRFVAATAETPATMSMVPGPGVFLNEGKIETMEFVDINSSGCYKLFFDFGSQ